MPQDVRLAGQHDTKVLERAANEERLVLTHDFATMLDYAYDRIERGLRMPEVLVPKKHPTDNIGAAFYTNKKLSRENKFSDALS